MSKHPFSFLQNMLKHHYAIGALFPSSSFVGQAMSRLIPEDPTPNYRILEVGAGTGTITREIAKKLQKAGRLDTYELIPDFCKILQEKINTLPDFQNMKQRIQLHQGDVLNYQPGFLFDSIISEVPFTNFHPDLVKTFLEYYQTLLKPGGTLIWIEYFLLRQIQKPFITKQRRYRLQAIEKIQDEYIQKYQFLQKLVFLNFPPAMIHYLRF